MKVTWRRMRHPAFLVPVVAAALFAGLGGGSAAQEQSPPGSDGGNPVDRGRELFVIGCSSCHGLDGDGAQTPDGTVRGPSLEDSGEAAAYYYLTTGRMPLASSEETPQRKEPAYDQREIAALVAYVGTLGDGPKVPSVDAATGDLAVGGELFRDNCQACHSATGAGGALSYGRAAPPLGQATPTQVGAAMRIGPGQMPVFGPDALNDDEVDAIARYVRYLEQPDDRGGIALGRLGPIPEGFLVWVLGMGLLLLVAYAIGKRSYHRREPGAV
jgi:ubiquinol-cytochrome c reductase cytochrome c subunit